jgi:hypothetical protein
MAQVVIKRENVRTKLKPAIGKTPITDWDSYLYSLWIEKIAFSPGLYDDAKISHISGLCKCGCTRAFTLEVRKKK